MAVLAVIGSLFASLLLFLIGSHDVVEAFLLFLRLKEPTVHGKENMEAVARSLGALDNFLIGFVLLYFAYSLYYLSADTEDRERRLGEVRLPSTFRVESLGEMKRTMVTVVLVSLSVFMLQELILRVDKLEYTDLILPASILSLAISLRLVKFED
jgi:uncharacterized membrane protein YqhA